MNRKLIQLAITMVAVILLAGCGSSGLGDILGGGDSGTVTNEQNMVRGTVDRVDTRNQTIVLRNADTYRSNLQNGGGSDTIYLDYDSNTTVAYGGQDYSPAALEPGDQIEASAAMVGNRLVADRISVTHDVSGNGTTTSPSTVTDLRGRVTDVDTRSRTLSVQQDSWNRTGQTYRVSYESNTPVYWQGRVYSPENLERGDLIQIDFRQSGNVLIAQEIEVIESSSTTQGTTNSFQPDLRGTVLSVDTRNNTITVQQPTWMQRFSTGTNTSNSVTLRYTSSTTVEYNGQLYAPENLERGDTVEIDVSEYGNTLTAEAIVVTSNARQSNF